MQPYKPDTDIFDLDKLQEKISNEATFRAGLYSIL
jgi:hypothetical protein